MIWLVLAVALIIALGVAILFLNRFYRKATRDVALVRTGAGGQRVIMDGGVFVLPFLHSVSEVSMKTMRLVVERAGPASVITADRLRVDTTVEFHVRVQPTRDGVATAAQALAGKAFRPAELAEMVEGKLVDAMLSVAARHSMDSLHENRGQYAAEVGDSVRDNLAQNGLALESVSLTRLDQTPFEALDENNAFNAVGMRRLAEVIANNRKQRAAIETDADVAVRRSQLEAVKRRLIVEQEEEEAQINQQMEIEKRRADSAAEIAEQRQTSERRAEQARIAREHEVRTAEIERDRALRKLETQSSLATELARHDSAIALARKRGESSKAQVEAEQARAEEVVAQELVETEKDKTIAERAKQVALIRAAEAAEVDSLKTNSEAGTVVARARAESDALSLRSQARKKELLSESEGRAALNQAENALSEPVIRMKLDMHKLDKLPELVGQMMKPVEKIDSIRINQISGFNGGGTGGGDAGERSLVNQAIDGILAMALQLPAVRRIGEELGINIGGGLEAVADAAGRAGESAASAADADKADSQTPTAEESGPPPLPGTDSDSS